MTESTLAMPEAEDCFKEFCADVFAALGRTDQRQAAQTYLYGLLNTPGRKSIRRLVATAPGRSEQSLQQFINQSPWDPEPIRRSLLGKLLQELRPTAWAIEEVHFPKHGRYSAAVERQYVTSLGRVSNCQLAITVTLTTEELTIPVNWRLIVPDAWGRDEHRRSRARMPEDELPRPYWQYHIEVLDDMALEWGMPPAPVLVDAAHRNNVEPFLVGLEQRRQPYLAQVNGSERLRCETLTGRPAGGTLSMFPPTGSPAPWHGTVSELVARVSHLSRETVQWPNEQDTPVRSQFIQVPIRMAAADTAGPRPPGPAPQRLLLCEWPLGRPRPRAFWITNILDRPLSHLVSLAKLRHRVGPRIEQFAELFGLRDYEGRTFAGWHHHVTLATAAYIYRVRQDLQAALDRVSGQVGRYNLTGSIAS